MSVQASSPDFVAIVTNAGVFLAAVGTVIAAIWTAVKKIKSVSSDETKGGATKMIGGAILDNTSMLLWSESNRGVIDALRDHQKEMMELRFAITRLVDKK